MFISRMVRFWSMMVKNMPAMRKGTPRHTKAYTRACRKMAIPFWSSGWAMVTVKTVYRMVIRRISARHHAV